MNELNVAPDPIRCEAEVRMTGEWTAPEFVRARCTRPADHEGRHVIQYRVIDVELVE